jgi:hypothetical protein
LFFSNLNETVARPWQAVMADCELLHSSDAQSGIAGQPMHAHIPDG